MIRVDLYALYRVDVLEWLDRDRCDYELLSGLIERLYLEPGSQWRAEQLGGERWFGWSTETAMLTELADIAAWGAEAGAINKVKFKQMFERPEPKKPKRIINSRDLIRDRPADLPTYVPNN